MKIEIADAATLPGWLQFHVSEGHLDLAAIPEPEDVKGLKSALEKERANVQAFKKLGTADEIAARIEDLEAKAAKGGKAGEDAQAKLDAIKGEYEGKLSEKDARIDKMMRANAAASLKAELATAGFIPEAIDDIAATALGRLDFAEDGTAMVLTSEGKPMIGSGADHGATLGDLAKELAASKPYAVRDGGKGGGGKQPGSNGGTPTMKRSEMSAEQKGSFIKEHGQNAYLQLPK